MFRLDVSHLQAPTISFPDAFSTWDPVVFTCGLIIS